MAAPKGTDRKEIGDVAMGLGADAGSAGIVRTKHVTFAQPDQELALEGGGTLAPFTGSTSAVLKFRVSCP